MAEIMGPNHYCSHMMMQADLDVESTNSEMQSLKRVNQDLEITLADTKLAQDATMLSRNEAMEGRDAAVARTRQLELERDRMVSEMQKLRHDRLAMEQFYSDVKKTLVAEQSAHEAKLKRIEDAFQQTLDEVKRSVDIKRMEKEQALRSKVKEEIYTYGLGFRRSTLFLIRERHLEIDLYGIDFLTLRGAEIPDKDDGEEENDEPIEQEMLVDDQGGTSDGAEW